MVVISACGVVVKSGFNKYNLHYHIITLSHMYGAVFAILYCSHEPLVGKVLIRHERLILDVLDNHSVNLNICCGCLGGRLWIFLCWKNQILLCWRHTGSFARRIRLYDGNFFGLLLLLTDLIDRIQDLWFLLLLLLLLQYVDVIFFMNNFLWVFGTTLEILANIIVD